MIDAVLRTPRGEILVAGAVRGHWGDVAPLLGRLATFAPRGVGLGVSFDELTSLNDHFADRPFEPLVPLTSAETAEVLGLSRFGEVRVPSPAYVSVLEWAHAQAVPVEALDLSDEQYALLFAEHISYIELVRRTLRERRLTRAPPDAGSADEYVVRWDRSLASGRGSQAFLSARARAVGAAARRLTDRVGRAAVVVDRERFDAVVGELRAPG